MNQYLPFVIITMLAIMVIGCALNNLAQGQVNTNANDIAGVTQFYLTKDGSLHIGRFSLVDYQGYAAASDALVNLTVTNDRTLRQQYNIAFNVSAAEFKEYSLLLTGQPVFAFMFQITDMGPTGIATAKLEVTLPNGQTFVARDKVSNAG